MACVRSAPASFASQKFNKRFTKACMICCRYTQRWRRATNPHLTAAAVYLPEHATTLSLFFNHERSETCDAGGLAGPPFYDTLRGYEPVHLRVDCSLAFALAKRRTIANSVLRRARLPACLTHAGEIEFRRPQHKRSAASLVLANALLSAKSRVRQTTHCTLLSTKADAGSAHRISTG